MYISSACLRMLLMKSLYTLPSLLPPSPLHLPECPTEPHQARPRLLHPAAVTSCCCYILLLFVGCTMCQQWTECFLGTDLRLRLRQVDLLQQGAGIARGSVLGSLSCLVRRRGFDIPLGRIFSGRGDFSLGVDMGSDSIPSKLFQMEVCTEV